MNVSSPVPYVKQQLIYLLYGERRIYQLEAKLSILTAVARCKPAELPVIRVLTDQPQAFVGWPVEVITLDEQTLQAWTGDGGYTHRRKACAIDAKAGPQGTGTSPCPFVAGAALGKMEPQACASGAAWHRP
nr:hypothetical protein [Pseudomonas sp. Irchel 3F3]